MGRREWGGGEEDGGEVDEYRVAGVLGGEGGSADAAAAEGVRDLDHGAQWLRFDSIPSNAFNFVFVACLAPHDLWCFFFSFFACLVLHDLDVKSLTY